MIDEQKLKEFLGRWIQIPDEQADSDRMMELEAVFKE